MKEYMIEKQSYRSWKVTSQDWDAGVETEYYVRFDDSKEQPWKCTCAHWTTSNGRVECKHIKMVKKMYGFDGGDMNGEQR